MPDDNAQTAQDTQTTQTTQVAQDPKAAMEQAALQMAVDSGQFTLPANFKTVEEFYRSYRAMQAQTTKVAQENARLRAATSEPRPEPEAAPSAVEDMASMLTKPDPAGGGKIDWAAVKAELAGTGDISPATREAVIKAGMDNDVLAAMVSDHKRRVKEDAAAAASLVGGEKELQALLTWARDNFSQEDARSLQSQLRGDGWRLAILGLKELHRQKTGTKEPSTTVDGRPGPGGSGKPQPFSTREELARAIADPKYRYNLEYRKEIEARILASPGLVNAKTTSHVNYSTGGRR